MSQRGQNGTLCPSEALNEAEGEQETKGGELTPTGIGGV